MPSSTFFGREAERHQLLELVDAGSLVTVTGPGGIGKTRLVAEALRGRAGVLNADLAPLPAGSDAGAVAAELGFASPEAVAASLSEAPAVVVLDSCEHVLDAVADLVAMPLDGRADATRIVITSREPLGVAGERVFVLGPLAAPAGDVDVESSPAVQLFLDRAAGTGADWDRSARTLATVAQLCRELDGLPLAIELAAARARALPPPDLLAHMSRRLDLLRAPAPGRSGRPPRHDSVRAAIEVSVDLLDDLERSLLCSLGVFRGGFTADLAHAVGAAPGADRIHTIDLLTRLVDRSLLLAERSGDATRYRLLRVVRAYAVEAVAGTSDEEVLAERYVDAMAAEADAIVAQGVVQWSGELVARVDAEFRDLLAAIGWCVEHDADPARACRLLLPLFASVHESRSQEVLAAGRAVFERWPGQRVPWRGEAVAVVATAAVLAGDHEVAVALGTEAAADRDALAIARVIAHRALGLAARSVDDLLVARARFAAARQEAALFGAASFERELATYEASTLALLGEPEEAEELLGWVVDGAAAAGDAITEVGARLARATTAIGAGRWGDARADIAAGRAAIERLAHPWWQGAMLRLEAAVIAGDEGGWDESVEAWQRAVHAAAAAGSAGELALTLRTAAVMASTSGREDVALRLVAAIPDSDELSILPLLFPDELERLETLAGCGARPDMITALSRARDALLGATRPPPATAAVPPAPGAVAAEASLRRDGDGWTVAYGDATVSLRHLKGISDLAVLLASPGVEVHCLELIGGAQVGGDAGPLIDGKARQAYEARIRELQEEIDDAARDGRPELAAKAEVELDALVDQLSEAFGLGGRARATGSSAERARTAVTYRVRAAVRRIASVHPELGRHLENSVRTGTWCSYRPETDVAWDVSAAPGGQTVKR